MRRVLVTGGSGFIGSHVIDALIAAGVTPRIFDLRPSTHHPPADVDTVTGDLGDVDALRSAMDGCEAVIHLAAYADVGEVAKDPVAAERVNSRGTLAVLEAARDTGARVIYGSTVWVYGESGEGFLDEESPVGLPAHLYTATKLAGEMYCTSYRELYDVNYTILRFGIPYGPRARPAAVIPIFAAKAAAGEPLTIAGDGKQTRRFVYVEDLAAGIVRALDPAAENEIFNLAAEESVTILELAEIIRDAVGEVEIVHTPGRNGDFGGAVISSARAERVLGWSASTPVREGVDRYIDWAVAEGVLASDPPERMESAPAKEPELPPSAAARGPRLPVGFRATILAGATGLLIPLLLAARTDDFGTGQAHSVAALTLVSILGCLALIPRFGIKVLGSGLIAGWSLVILIALGLLPWTNHLLTLDRPSLGSLALVAIGTTIALTVAIGTDWFRDEELAKDRAG